jgi:hypothetical protein
MDLSIFGNGQDTENGPSEQTTDDRLDSLHLIGQEPFGNIKGAKRLRELVARTCQIISMAVMLKQLKCLRLPINLVLIKPAISI